MPQPSRPAWKDWVPVISIVLGLVGSIIVAGGYINQVKENTRRIEVLERANESRDVKLDDIRERTTRIEAKIEVLLPAEQRTTVR